MYPLLLISFDFRLEKSMHRTPTSLGTLVGFPTTMPTEDERANKRARLTRLQQEHFYLHLVVKSFKI